MAKKGLLIVFSGPSGVGKGTVLKKFMPTADDCVFSVSATTRQMREGEVDGVNYHYITREEFQGLIDRGETLEYTLYNGNYYGTLKKKVLETIDRGLNVILEIEVEGAVNVRNMYPESVLVFVAPPQWQSLEERLRGRHTETDEQINGRLTAAKHELSLAKEYDYIIVNDNADDCATRLQAVITAAKCESKRNTEFILEVVSNA